MAASGQIARGTVLDVSISSTLTEIPACNPINVTKNKPAIDITGLNDGDDQDVAPGIRTGEYSFTINFDGTNSVHDYLQDSFHSNTKETWQLTQADAETDDFSGYVTQFDTVFDKDDVQKANVTVTRAGSSTLS